MIKLYRTLILDRLHIVITKLDRYSNEKDETKEKYEEYSIEASHTVL